MATLIFFVLGGILATACVLAWERRHAISAWRPRRNREPVRMVECFGCFEPLPIDEAHVVAAVPDDDDEREMMGGTVMVAEYHAEHCPGGCQYGHALAA